ncbi:MAG TPA: sn-glycerol-3-phosphate ABC transporter ATP-binding protein UgpC [Steroidobacteraceae bacterium]
MATISLIGVEKSYGDSTVLRGIDLEIADGEFIVLVGPSGCGKSTLLRLIAGLDQVTHGEIRIDGRPVNAVAAGDRDLAMVFQSYALYPHMSVRENMSFSLKLRGLPAAQIEAAVRAASVKLGLESLLDRRPRELSGGQRQRVAMGRALVRQPKAFLFDEPLSNLDARLREQMRYEIRKLQRDLGITSIYVTHDQIEAMTMADRIVALNQGAIQQIGSPAELYGDPANLFVAGFIGSPAMNFLEARVDGSAVRIGDITVADGRSANLGSGDLGRRAPQAPASGSRVTVGLRPERIAIMAPSAGTSARVDLVEPTGLGNVVHVSVADQHLKVFTTERIALRPGELVGLGVQAADILLFDPGTGVRLRAR